MKPLYCNSCSKITNHYKQHYSYKYPTTSAKDFVGGQDKEAGFFCYICSCCNSQSQHYEYIPLKISSND